MSPTARTLMRLRSRGYIAEKVEQTIPHTFIKREFEIDQNFRLHAP